jgi:hypothetical protein
MGFTSSMKRRIVLSLTESGKVRIEESAENPIEEQK